MSLGAASVLAPAATANPGDGGPGGSVGIGDVYITSATTVAEGQRIYFAGENFAQGGNATTPAMQVLSLKLDAAGPAQLYSGSAADGSGVVGTYQLQADGTFSGSLLIPDDIDDPAVNPASADGPHFLRLLGSNPALSRWSEDFEVDNTAAAAPVVTATAVTAASRGNVTVTVTVTGSGFTPGENVSVTRALAETPFNWTVGTGAGTPAATIAADDSGNLSGRIVLSPGVLPSGEYQLVFGRSSAPDNPAVAQVTVQPSVAFANLALDSDGTITLNNAAPGTIFTTVQLDPSPAAGDEIDILAAPFTANSAGVATGSVHVPDGAYLGTRDFVVGQSFPYTKTYTASAKISPSSAVFGVDGYDRVETPDGAIDQGLYQSAYSAASDALFVTTANVTTTSRIYKLDPDTLEVEASVVPAYVSGDSGPLWAAYGIGVDDKHGTVWVTNTRQNTVAVYKQSDLSLLAQLPAGTITHSRDVVADPAHDLVFASSASEGSSGDGYIGVFEGADNDGDGTPYEHIENIAVHPRTDFSPMSLELDAAHNKLFTVSLTTQKAMVIDTETLEDTIIDLPDLMAGGRGASGVAYDAVTNRLFVASQNSDELLIAQLNSSMTAGTTVAEVPTGAGALNVAFDPARRLAYVANFGGTTITVTDVDGNKVANLPFTRVNHVAEDGSGVIYAVNKDTGNRVIRLSPKTATPPPPPPTPTPVVQSAVPLINGKATVGQPLTVAAGAWSPGATLSYQWKRAGAAILGATGSTYVPGAADVGKPLTVEVTGSLPGYTAASATSAATSPVAKGSLSGTKPKLQGKAKVGKVLKAKAGAWTKGSKLTYQWYVDGKKLKGATKKTLKVKAAYLGSRITVKVTGKLAGYQKLTKTSAKSAKVTR